MSLNCLTCGHILQRVNSDKDYLPENKTCKEVQMRVGRWWSGNISQPQCANRAIAKIKKEHRRTNSAGSVEPRLVRCSGMRRDWSFEDLTGHQGKRIRRNQGHQTKHDIIMF
ncbi:hypothetical protein RIF29_33206 [Crotalaria pallida]|uniref:Uncharacterized protein n=1 Tax=Crotalaria pallida TaxID=3830 RepID=A0AAN9E7W8_CROPI